MSNEQLIDTLYSIVDDPNNLLDGDATDAINEAIGRIGADSDEIARLRERDEARRELCAARRELCRDEAFIRLQRHRVHRDSEDVVGLAKEIAVERGWDCFKENTNG